MAELGVSDPLADNDLLVAALLVIGRRKGIRLVREEQLCVCEMGEGWLDERREREERQKLRTRSSANKDDNDKEVRRALKNRMTVH